MKRIVAIIALSTIGLMPVVGCANKAVTTTVPGQINTADAVMYRALRDVQAAIDSTKAQIAAGTITFTSAQKGAFNEVISSYDLAQAAYLVYRGSNTTANLTAAQTAVSTMQTSFSTAMASNAVAPTAGVTAVIK